MRSRIAWSTPLLGTLFFVPATALSQECNPTPNTGELTTLVDSRNSTGLSQHLFSTAGVSGDFKNAHGVDRIQSAIDGLVRKYLEGRTQDDSSPSVDESVELAAKFREGILAACEAVNDDKSGAQAKRKAIRAANLTGGDSEYVVLLGTANSLEGDGNFSSGLEASFQSTTNFQGRNIPGIGLIYDDDSEQVVTGTFEITFSEIGSIDDDADPDMMAGMSGDMNRNPFAAGGGFFRLNTSADFYLAPKGASGLGFRVGGGFSTLPSNNATDDVDTRGRGYGGFVFRANYGAEGRNRAGKGEVFIGLAKDKFWKFDRVTDASAMPPITERVNETERIVVDARMDIPQVFQSEDVRMHARLFADTPASGKGPSDIRISLLLTVNLGAFFPIN